MSVAPAFARMAEAMPEYAGLDLLATGVLVVEEDGTVSFANQAAEVLLETSRRHLVGQTVQRLFADEHQFERLQQSAAAGDLGQQGHTVELRRP
jgi:nitrogen-specific signal transduction histidine kinase